MTVYSNDKNMSWIKNRPLRIILCIQLLVTAVLASVLWIYIDVQSALSAVFGGMVSFISSAVYALMISQHKGYTAGEAIRTALRAEAVKIVLIVVLLWMVFAFYDAVNPVVFIATFILTVIVYSMALFISDSAKR